MSLSSIEDFIFYFFLVAIPFQTRKIFYYPDWYFNEWRAIVLYGTDILILVLFGFWLYRSRPFRIKLKWYDFFLLAFVGVAAISLKSYSVWYLGLYQFFKLLEFVLFYFYVKNYAAGRFTLPQSLMALSLGGLFQAMIAIAQYVRQSDIGLRLFGETVLKPQMEVVASFFVASGEKIMRAYGTTPHPNILALYLLLSIVAVGVLILKYLIQRPPLYTMAVFVGLAVIIFGFLATFSRTTIILWPVLALIWLYWNYNSYRNKLAPVIIVSLVTVVIFAVLNWPEVQNRVAIHQQDEAVRLRLDYAREALSIKRNWFGIGLGNFVYWSMTANPHLTRSLYQPVHNIYLLVYSETGVAGISVFAVFLAGLLISKRHHKLVLSVFLAVLAIGFFDHFLLTLQQGRIMFWLMAGYYASQHG